MTDTSAAIKQPIHSGAVYKAAYDQMLGNTETCDKIVNLLSNGILMAVFVIGCVGAAQLIPAAEMGWTIVGLGGAYSALKLLACRLGSRKIDLLWSVLTNAVVVSFGALTALGILTTGQAGYALIGVSLANTVLAIQIMLIAKKCLPVRKKLSSE